MAWHAVGPEAIKAPSAPLTAMGVEKAGARKQIENTPRVGSADAWKSAIPTVRKDPCAEEEHYHRSQQQNADDTREEHASAD